MINRIKILLPEIEQHLIDMENCEQDKTFHSEGNVLIHTKLVLEEVEKLTDINEKDKELLRWLAFFHDIGKPYCSIEEDDYIRSHGHSRIGYHITRKLLEKVDILSFEDKLQIINLVKYHGDPNFVINKKNPEYEIIKMSMDVNMKLLYHFALCDTLGRIAPDYKEFVDNIECFKIIAQDLNCFEKPYQFQSDIAKYNYIIKRTHHHLDIPFNDTKSKVHLMCGIPGVGKDTWIKNNLNKNIVSLDEIRKELKIKPNGNQGQVIQLAKERAKEYLRKGENFVWNATNTTRKMRNQLISLFTDYNAYITIICVNDTLEHILIKNNQRESAVPEKVIRKLHRNLEIPRQYEAHHVKIINL